MKKFDTNNPENLSAFLDDELSTIQKEAIEQKLLSNPELQRELQELAETSQAVKSLPPIPSDPYFETRLLERISHESDGYASLLWSRKPVIALAMMTLIVFVVFKLNPNLFQQVVETNQKNLANIYAKNLRSLLYATNLTNDDIFNFALNKSLPINKENNQVLSLGNGHAGEEILEVKEASASGVPMNVETFAKKIGLSGEEKKQLNSLLQGYYDKIASAVLVNDNNGLAVNHSLWNYQTELRREILDFVSENKKEALEKILPSAEFTELKSPIMLDGDTKNNPNIYYYISPDTFFTSSLPVDNERIQQQIAMKKQAKSYKGQLESEMKNVRIELSQLAKTYKADGNSHEIRIYADSNLCQVVIPRSVRPVKVPARIDAISRKLDSAFSNFKQYTFDYRFNENNQTDVDAQLHKYSATPSGRERLVRSGSRSSIQNYNFDGSRGDSFYVHLPGTKTGITFRGLPPGIVLDSLNRMLLHYFTDSAANRSQDQWSKGINDFKKEMEQMRKELEKLRKEMQKQKEKKGQQIETGSQLEI